MTDMYNLTAPVELTFRVPTVTYGFVEVTFAVDWSQLDETMAGKIAAKVAMIAKAVYQGKQTTAPAKKKWSVEDREEQIAAYIRDHPDEIATKKKEMGDMIDDKTAAMLLLKKQEEEAAVVAPIPESVGTMTIYKSQYGYSVYAQDVQALFDWLIAIPMERRRRKSAKYPAISNNGKYVMVNDVEKELIVEAAKAAAAAGKPVRVVLKEDTD